MQTYELRVYKLRTIEALDFHREVIYRASSHGSSCWSPMPRAQEPARSVGGICKAQNSLTTSKTLMLPT